MLAGSRQLSSAPGSRRDANGIDRRKTVVFVGAFTFEPSTTMASRMVGRTNITHQKRPNMPSSAAQTMTVLCAVMKKYSPKRSNPTPKKG